MQDRWSSTSATSTTYGQDMVEIRTGSGATPSERAACSAPRRPRRESDNNGICREQGTAVPHAIAPIYQYRPWGGHQLADLLSAPLPTESHVGEAWV